MAAIRVIGNAMPGKSRIREIVAAACCVLGALILAGGVLMGYASRVVFDADTFAFRAARTLQEPRVAVYVAEQLSDALIAQNRDLVAYRPILVASARLVVASEPFAAVLRRAARTAHAVVLSKSAEKVYLTLPDVSVLLRAAARSESEVLDKLPERVQLDLSDDLDRVLGRPALAALQFGNQLTRLSWSVFVGGVLLLVLGLAMARDRRAALSRTAISMGIAAAALFLLPPIVERFLALRIREEALRSLVAGVWHSLSSGIRLRALVLAAIAVVLTAAARPPSRRLLSVAALRRAGSLLAQPAQHAGLELLRLLVAIALGLTLVVEPLGTLRVALMLAGAFVAVEGFHGVFARIAPYVERPDSTARERPVTTSRERPQGAVPARPWRWVALTTVVLAAGVAATAFLQSPRAVPTPRFAGACNGDASLCRQTLDEIVLPGAHNAMSAADVPGWMFPNQERGIGAQLQDGIRALLLDVHYGTPVGGAVRTELHDEAAAREKYETVLGREGVDAAMRIRDRLVGEAEGPRATYLCHGFCELGAQSFTPALREIRDFLVQNPGEVLVIVVEDNVEPADVAAAFEHSGLVEFVYRGRPEPPWQALGEMVAADQRVVVLAENDAAGVPWYHLATEVMQETPYSVHALDEFSCEPQRGGTQGSLFLVNHWIDSAPAPKPSNAEVVNRRDFLLERVQRCEATRGKRVNVIAVDFYRTGDVVEVAAILNRTRFGGAP